VKVLIADKFEEKGVAQLKAAGCEVVHDPGLSGDALRAAIAELDPQVLVVRSTKVDEAALQASMQLSVVVRAGAGFNTIDVEAASGRAIMVANCPGKNSVAVAELTFGLILALDRRIVDNVVDLRRGLWRKKEYGKARGLKGRTLGVVGLGQIGRAVVKRARAFEMPVVAWSRSLTDAVANELGVVRCESPSEVARGCDVFSVHVAACDETRNIIDAKVLGKLRPGSYVINTSRADVLDYRALLCAMKELDLRVGLDVFPEEPKSGESDFRSPMAEAGALVYGTHHIGASTDQAQAAIADETVRIVKEYARTGRVAHCVNLCERSAARHVLVVRHRNRPGVLAHTLNAISFAGVNVDEMQNVICEGLESACARIKLNAPLPDEIIRKIESENEHVLAVTFASIDDE